MSCVSSTKNTFKRLPSNLSPSHYDIEITPDLESCTFTGSCSINVQINESTDQITLNAADLLIQESFFSTKSGGTCQMAVTCFPESEIITLSSPILLEKGCEGIIKLSFEGTLSDKLKGFYRSKYFSMRKQKDQFAAVCHFEPTSARRAFPCWDEPIYKATFAITLVVPKDLVALSNMPVVQSESISENSNRIVFDRTPLMSTYLVAFVLGEFDFVEAILNQGTGNKIAVRVYTPSGKSSQGTYSLNFAVKSLAFYNHYFDIECNLPKMDLIAIPDFAIGAMENWGLITFRESRLLVDDQHTSPASKQNISLIVAHEISHFWFGNLVTMNWWTHLWLKEGFASFIMYMSTNVIHPEYLVWEQFVSTELAEALALDALHSSHAIEVPVTDPAQIGEIFDDISYSKGASVIRMLHSYLDDDNFRKGLQLYLRRHSFKNAATEDLWKALEEVCNKPVGPVMSTWTLQKGYPVITVSEKHMPGSTDRVLILKQEKFCADNRIPKLVENTRWMIPITIVKSSSPSKVSLDVLLSAESAEVEITEIGVNEWVKLNSGTVGVYRVQYSKSMLEKLVMAVRDNSLPSLDRLGLINDLFALVLCGRVTTSEFLKMVGSFKNEENFTVWSTIDSCLERLDILLSESNLVDAFHSFGRSLLQRIYTKVGWQRQENESHVGSLLRSLVINRLASFRDPEVINKARELFMAHLEGKWAIPPDLKSPIYRAVSSSATDESDLNNLLQLYRETDLNEEKVRLSKSLGLFSSPPLIERVIEFSMSADVRSQDTIFVLSSISAGSKAGREKVWNFFKNNFKLFIDRYEGSHLMWKLVKCLTENFSSDTKAKEVEDFFMCQNIRGIERSLEQSIETILLNHDLLKRDELDIKAFLTSSGDED